MKKSMTREPAKGTHEIFNLWVCSRHKFKGHAIAMSIRHQSHRSRWHDIKVCMIHGNITCRFCDQKEIRDDVEAKEPPPEI